jgi:flagellar basal-body rod protein FlgB
MPISEFPIFSMLRTRMQWHQERQRLLAENVANANTPNFKPRDLAAPQFNRAEVAARPVAMAQTSQGHIVGSLDATGSFRVVGGSQSEVGPAGNGVSLEDEMLKVAANQMDFQAATALYTRGLGLIKTALGRR